MTTPDQEIVASARPLTTSNEVLPGLSKAKAAFLCAAGLSFLLSIYLYFGGDREGGIFVGIWVPSILSSGALLMGGDVHE